MKTLLILVEEPSAKEFFKGILPRVISNEIRVQYRIFEGKSDLQKRLTKTLVNWQQPDTTFLVMQDQDSNDCHKLKWKLLKLVEDAGKERFLVRIACHELETFYLGDLSAVERGLGLKGIARQQEREKYRDPDKNPNPSQILEQLTGGEYQKVRGSKLISNHLSLEANRSHSFRVLLEALHTLTE